MVNRGRSGACVTCKQRRVKCDEGKPTCKTCKRLKLECGGYTQKKQLRFKDQTHKFCTPDATADGKVIVFQAEKHVTGANDGKTPSVASSSPALSVESFDDLILTNNDSADPLCYDLDVLEEIAIPNVPRSLPVTDTAVPFFLSYYASMGRDRRSARGFFEVFVPVYRTQLQDSPLSLAVLALSTGILSLWRQDRFDTSPKLYTRALACLRQSLSDASERNKPATLLAILTLQLYENVAAVYGLRSALPVHHNGAISLLPPAESGNADNMIQEHTQRYMLHIESSSALRQKRPIRQEASSWIESKALSKTTNPSTTLDAIGATVAGFQAFHLDLAGSATYEPLSSERLDQSIAEANDIEARLTNWAENMPMHMQPLRLDNVDSLIPTYQATCDVFQSCQTANLWNLWHCQRLILAKVLIGFVERILGKQLMELDEVRLTLLLDMSAKYTSILQDSLDSVCYSVPFYLGNRTRPISLLDFSDPLIILPSCDLGGVPDYEHRQHIIARGAWHVMSPLSHVLTLFSDADGLSVAKLLRPGQLEWVREQFVRSLVVIRLTPSGSGDWERQAHLLSAGHGVAHADYLAKEVRKGAMIMSGL